jgi:NADH-dependent peroxiredoxin subunit F
MHELLIIGGGPAGVAAGVYAARKKIKTILVTDFFGGQSLVSADIRNWIGTVSISGFELGKSLENHLKVQEDIEVLEGDVVTAIEEAEGKFTSFTREGKKIESKTILVVSGSHHKKLEVPGERELEGRGVVYCSTCDAPLFKGKTVAVIGGGNSGFEAVMDLLPYAEKIYLMHRRESFRGDPITMDKIRNNPKVSIILNAETENISGENNEVHGLRYRDTKTGAEKDLAVQGVFVEVGLAPNSGFIKNLVTLDDWGQVVVDHRTQQTSKSGIWAAGDVTNALYKQNNISVGDSIKAVLNIYDYLRKT